MRRRNTFRFTIFFVVDSDYKQLLTAKSYEAKTFARTPFTVGAIFRAREQKRQVSI